MVWVEGFRDPSAAYEVYTAGLHPGMMASLVGTNAAVGTQAPWHLMTALENRRGKNMAQPTAR